MSAFRHYVKRYIWWIKFINRFKQYFSNGLYFVHCDSIHKKVELRPFIIVLSFKHKIKSDNSCFMLAYADKNWSQKYVVKKGPFVFSLYSKTNSNSFLERTNKYINEIVYDHPEYFLLNKQRGYSISSFINGESYIYSEERCIDAAKYILTKNARSTFIDAYNYDDKRTRFQNASETYTFVSYLQHGDLALNNVLFNKTKITIIDFDTVDIYPALYDFFRVIIAFPNVMNKFFENEFDELLLMLFAKTFESRLSIEELKDKYFGIFIMVSPWDVTRYKKEVPNTFLCSIKAF